jgi:hypothetical protein
LRGLTGCGAAILDICVKSSSKFSFCLIDLVISDIFGVFFGFILDVLVLNKDTKSKLLLSAK